MRQILCFLLFTPVLVLGQRVKQAQNPEPFRKANVIRVETSLAAEETVKVILHVLQKASRPVAKIDSVSYFVETGIFTLSPAYDMQMQLLVNEGRVSLWGTAINRAGETMRAVCDSPLRGASGAFAHLNYLALLLQSQLGNRAIHYAIE